MPGSQIRFIIFTRTTSIWYIKIKITPSTLKYLFLSPSRSSPPSRYYWAFGNSCFHDNMSQVILWTMGVGGRVREGSELVNVPANRWVHFFYSLTVSSLWPSDTTTLRRLQSRLLQILNNSTYPLTRGYSYTQDWALCCDFGMPPLEIIIQLKKVLSNIILFPDVLLQSPNWPKKLLESLISKIGQES